MNGTNETNNKSLTHIKFAHRTWSQHTHIHTHNDSDAVLYAREAPFCCVRSFTEIYSAIMCLAMHCTASKIKSQTQPTILPDSMCCLSNVHWHDRSHCPIIFRFPLLLLFVLILAVRGMFFFCWASLFNYKLLLPKIISCFPCTGRTTREQISCKT